MLQGQTYVPLVFSKGAELKAIAKLENFTKPNIFPIVCIRPGSHNEFPRTIDGVKSALGNLRFGLELDRHKRGKSKRSPAREQFDQLFEPADGFSNYYSFVESWGPNAIPVIRSDDGIFDSVQDQLAHIIRLDRGAIVHIERHYTRELASFLDASTLDLIDHMFVINASWSDDILQAEGWCNEVVAQIFERYPESEIACISSSYPRDFRQVKSRFAFSNDDRELFDRIRRAHNQARLTFGDWASTRTSVERITNQPRPRIDVPTPREWISFRLGDKEKGGFQSVSKRVMGDRVWLETPDCWGKRMIDLTASHLPGKIDSDHKAHIARIHLHITIQAMGGIVTEIPDEPYKDPF